MSKTVKETKLEIAAAVKKSAKGKKIVSFSRTDFNTLANSYLNDVNYEMETVTKDGDKIVPVKSTPVKEFREKIIMPVLIEGGVPKEDAAKLATEYQFKKSQTDVMYDVSADLVHQFLDCGKKFSFPNREDFTGSIQYNEIEAAEGNKEYTNPKTKEKFTRKEKRKAHKVLAKKSSCPSWLVSAMK